MAALSVVTLVPLLCLTPVLPTVDELPLESLLAAELLAPGQADQELDALILSRLQRLELPASGEEWRLRSGEIRRRVLENVVFRGWPREVVERKAAFRCIDSDIKTGKGYLIRKLLYEPYPGLWIPALLYEPTGFSRGVAVLNVNGHVGPAGKTIDYKQIQCANLARRGMTVLNPEWFSFGELGIEGYRHNGIAWLDLCGRSGVGLFHLALRGAVDVLLAQPGVDPERIAVTGLSGGGWQTILLAALDERVKACAPNAGYIGLEARLLHGQDIGDLEQVPADLLLEADYTHLTALLVPRPALLIYNARDDCCFAAARARASVHEPVRPFFERFAPWAELTFHENEYPGDHNYGLDNRQAFYRFLDRLWVPPRERQGDEVVCEGDVRPFDELQVGVPEGNLTFHSIALELARGLPGVGAEKLKEDEGLRDRVRARLQGTLRVSRTCVTAAEAVRDASGRLTSFRARLSSGLTAPVTVGGPENADITLFVSDAGRAETAREAREEIGAGRRVLAADLLFAGERRARRLDAWQRSMLLSSAGVRALGQAAAEILALADWARRDLGAREVRVEARGGAASLAALVAAALDGGGKPRLLDRVTARDAPASLKDSIQPGASPERTPHLLAFGLLEVADIAELRVLAARGVVQ